MPVCPASGCVAEQCLVHCVYCAADVAHGPVGIHAVGCAFTTGRFPVEVGDEGPGLCMWCDNELVGFYMLAEGDFFREAICQQCHTEQGLN